MSIETEPLLTIRLGRDAERSIRIADGPRGTRGIATVAEGGTFEGPRVRGEILFGTSGDWSTLRPDGSFLIDARLTLMTHDGAPILMTYKGVGAFDENGDAWMHAAPLFETGDERYEWLNGVQGVAHGSLDGDTVVYEVQIMTR
ncbi:MAG: DUF3237 domain-containing protein [Actinomycetota bacterium]|nr:DUF3237 domain-containing protein [Actinomycetota bacterium]